MKRASSLLAVVLPLLAACAPSNQPPPCPYLGVDVQSPDFYQPVAPEAVEATYHCQITQVNTRSVWGMSAQDRYYAQSDLQYQWALWRQVFARQMTPGQAQQRWIEFSTTQYYQRSQLEESERTGAAIRRSTYDDSHDSSHAGDSHRSHPDHGSAPSPSRPSSLPPSAPAPASPPDPKAALDSML